MSLPHIKLLFLKKWGLELVFLSPFLNYFWRKIFLMLYPINWTNFIAWLLLVCEILGNMCILNACFSGWDVIKFETNLIFLIEPFFWHEKKVKTKIYLTWEQTELLSWNNLKIWKFWIILNNFEKLSLKHIKQTFLEGESLI